jgi:hypothetical protein
LHPGEESLLLHVEVVLKAYLITAADLSCALNVSKIIAFANDSSREQRLQINSLAGKRNVAFSMPMPRGLVKSGIDSSLIKTPTLSQGLGRIWSKISLITSTTLHFSRFLIELRLRYSSQEMHKFDSPVLINTTSNIVEDESLAVSHPVTVDIIDVIISLAVTRLVIICMERVMAGGGQEVCHSKRPGSKECCWNKGLTFYSCSHHKF